MSLKKAWIIGVVGYSILRAVIAWGLFRDFGVNPWIFGAIDIGTAVPYAWAIAEVPGAIVDSRYKALARYVVVAMTTFFAPYGYIWLAAEAAPADLQAGLVIVVACLFVAAVIGIWRKTHVIDLTDPINENETSTMVLNA